MQVHKKVKDLIFNFVEFLDSDSLYLWMIAEKERWEMINAEHEWIKRDRRNIADVRKTMISKWEQKLLNIWISKQDLKMSVMSKMHVIINRVENKHLMKAMMKQVIYNWAAQAIISRERISVSSFS